MTAQLIDRIGWMSIGFILGAFLTGTAIAGAILDYDRSMRMFDSLRRRYGAQMERRPES